jgi:hypothetical protein
MKLLQHLGVDQKTWISRYLQYDAKMTGIRTNKHKSNCGSVWVGI